MGGESSPSRSHGSERRVRKNATHSAGHCQRERRPWQRTRSQGRAAARRLRELERTARERDGAEEVGTRGMERWVIATAHSFKQLEISA